MRQLLFLISILPALSACGSIGARTTDVSLHVSDNEIPRIDCRPYPRPGVLELGDIEPQSRADGWFISHEDYKELSDMWDATILYMKQTRAIASYFADCIGNYNRSLAELEQRSRQGGPAPGEAVREGARFRLPPIFSDLFR